MSVEYQRLNMVAQLGSDPSVVEQQQQLALAEQQNVGAGAEQPIGATGANPSPAMVFARSPSQSTATIEADETLSDDSLTVSPDGKTGGARVGPSRSGARSLSTTRSRKTSAVTKPLVGRRKSESPARAQRVGMAVTPTGQSAGRGRPP